MPIPGGAPDRLDGPWAAGAGAGSQSTAGIGTKCALRSLPSHSMIRL